MTNCRTTTDHVRVGRRSTQHGEPFCGAIAVRSVGRPSPPTTSLMKDARGTQAPKLGTQPKNWGTQAPNPGRQDYNWGTLIVKPSTFNNARAPSRTRYSYQPRHTTRSGT